MSKQQAIVPGQCYELEDGSSSFKDFHGSRNNRFASPEQAAKNRIQHPSNVLHFFNAQPDVTPELFSQVGANWSQNYTFPRRDAEAFAFPSKSKCAQLFLFCFCLGFFPFQICEEIGVKAPVNVKMFTGKGKLLEHQVHFEPGTTLPGEIGPESSRLSCFNHQVVERPATAAPRGC